MTKKRNYKLPLMFLATFLAGSGFGMYLFQYTHPLKVMCMFMLPPGVIQ